jgi:hypothetical protein
MRVSKSLLVLATLVEGAVRKSLEYFVDLFYQVHIGSESSVSLAAFTSLVRYQMNPAREILGVFVCVKARVCASTSQCPALQDP